TEEAVLRAARDDNATVVNADLSRIVRKNTMLRAAPIDSPTSHGTRHASAEDFSTRTGHPVLVVSNERQTVTVLLDGRKYLLRPRSELSETINRLMATLSRE